VHGDSKYLLGGAKDGHIFILNDVEQPKMIKLDISEDVISLTPLMEAPFIYCICFRNNGARFIEIRKIGSNFQHAY
jgi:hypothetical protein